MKKMILAMGLIFVASSSNAKVIQCIDAEGASLQMTAKFNSEMPNLTASLVVYNPDGSVGHAAKTEYLMPTSVCNVTVTFGSDCEAKERQNSLGYSYQFQCKSKKISGEFYVDENGNGSLSCSNQTGATIFFGCKLNKL